MSVSLAVNNIKVGRNALNGVKQIYPRGFVSNTRYEAFSTHVNPQIKAKLEDRIEATRDIVDFKKRQGFTEYEAVKFAVAETQTANCGEQAVILSDFLNKSGIKHKIVSMSVYKQNSTYPFDGHNFCVIGMDDGAKAADPETWGKNAVIVDLWTNTVDKAGNALRYFLEVMDFNKKAHTVDFREPYI